jgi:hypothetical protein
MSSVCMQTVFLDISLRFSNCARPTRRVILGLWGRGARVVYMRDIYFELNMDTHYIYIGRNFTWLKYSTYHLVPVLTPNYKQHILSPAKVTFLSLSQHAD